MAEDKTKVWKYVGIGCAVLVLLGLGTCGGLAYFTKKKIDQAGGAQAFASTLITQGGAMIALPALPEPERTEAKQVLEAVQAKAKHFTQDDVKALGEAMERLGKAQKVHENRMPTAEEARAFIAECKEVADKH